VIRPRAPPKRPLPLPRPGEKSPDLQGFPSG
jgi:hypothetical protein